MKPIPLPNDVHFQRTREEPFFAFNKPSQSDRADRKNGADDGVSIFVPTSTAPRCGTSIDTVPHPVGWKGFFSVFFEGNDWIRNDAQTSGQKQLRKLLNPHDDDRTPVRLPELGFLLACFLVVLSLAPHASSINRTRAAHWDENYSNGDPTAKRFNGNDHVVRVDGAAVGFGLPQPAALSHSLFNIHLLSLLLSFST